LPVEPYHPWPETLAQLLDQLVRKCGDEQAAFYRPLIREAADSIGIADDDPLHPEEARTLLYIVGLPPEVFGFDAATESDKDPEGDENS
jgi:hypothetical protein